MDQVYCHNCDCHMDELVIENQWPDIDDLGERLAPGDIVPFGECPTCQSLVYICMEDN